MKKKEKIKRCLTDKEIALFIDKKKEYEGYERIIHHFSECDSCLNKTIDVWRLIEIDLEEVPENHRESLFMMTGMSLKKKRYFSYKNLRKPAFSLGIAASVLILLLAALFQNDLLKKADLELTDKNRKNERLLYNTNNIVRTNRGNIQNRLKIRKSLNPRKPKAYKTAKLSNGEVKNRLEHAGFLYFLLLNSECCDRNLLKQLHNDLSITGLDPIESVNLLRNKNFSSFQKKISELPERERKNFSEGYILSQLYYSDERGKVHGMTIEWGKKLVLTASTDKIRECMLYQR